MTNDRNTQNYAHEQIKESSSEKNGIWKYLEVQIEDYSICLCA